MSKQLKKFCRITKYIEKTNPKLYEILDDFCILQTIKPRRGHAGITFIMPSKDSMKLLETASVSGTVIIVASSFSRAAPGAE